MKKELSFYLLSALFISALISYLFFLDPYFFKSIELKTFDSRIRLTPKKRPYPFICIVAIDQKSINRFGRWPWSRGKIASLIYRLKELGAKEIVLDIVFSEKSKASDDRELSLAIKKTECVILGYFFRKGKESIEDKRRLFQLMNSSIKRVRMSKDADLTSIPSFPYVELNLWEFQRHALSLGAFNIVPDPDGVVRKANLIFRFKDSFYPSLPLCAAANYLKGSIYINIEPFGLEGIYLGGKKIKTDEAGSMWIRYYGHSKTIPTYSAADILDGKIQKKDIDGKIVFLGITEIGVSDLRPTPNEPLFPGVEINATACSNIIKGDFLKRNNLCVLVDLFFIVFPSFIFAYFFLNIRSVFLRIFIFFLSIFGYLFINLFSLYKFGLILNFIYPTLSQCFAFFWYEAYKNLVVERKNRYLRKAFSSYVAPPLVERIIEDAKSLKLGGEKREITVLFADIRGFTTISEKLSSQTLVRLLNDFFEPMAKKIMENNGMVDKFIGDAIMAVFNAPVDFSDHPYFGCKSAIQMLSVLEELNESWKKLGLPEISIGIGINTGTAVVGNVGASFRFDYTALGDTVNTASRLEGLNKTYGTKIIISEYTEKRVRGRFLTRELDIVRFKGKDIPIKVYELLEDKKELYSLKKSFEEALSLYRKMDFSKALFEFERILERFPYDGPTRLYIERCKKYLKSPPKKDWDGVYVALSK